MRKRWVYGTGGELVAEYHGSDCVFYSGETVNRSTEIMPDLAEFRSVDGAVISGRAEWREHLKKTDCVEMGHSDMKASQETWAKRKAAHNDRLRGQLAISQEFNQPTEVRELRRSNLNVEMANRLHGRPTPERIEMLKMTLDQMKRNRRG
jgi:hypothetical protein